MHREARHEPSGQPGLGGIRVQFEKSRMAGGTAGRTHLPGMRPARSLQNGQCANTFIRRPALPGLSPCPFTLDSLQVPPVTCPAPGTKPTFHELSHVKTGKPSTIIDTITEAKRALARREPSALDYIRSMKAAVEAGTCQVERAPSARHTAGGGQQIALKGRCPRNRADTAALQW